MKRLLAFLACVVWACHVEADPVFSPMPNPAPRAHQTPFAVIRMGVLLPTAHAYLRGLWSADPNQVERAYCASWHVGYVAGDTVFVIDSVVPAAFLRATPSSVSGTECAIGMVPIHVHTPTTCVGDTSCVLGGIAAYQCFPSVRDIANAERAAERHPFWIVQCGEDQLVFYQALTSLARQSADGTTVR